MTITILSAQNKNNYQGIKLHKIPSGTIFLPKLIDKSGKMNIILDKINETILEEFEITNYEEIAIRQWDEIDMSTKIGNDIILISITATLSGNVTGFGAPVSKSMYFNLINGDRLKEPAFVSPLSYFTTNGYLQFLKDYNIIEDYNIKENEAIKCANGVFPSCHLNQLEFSFNEKKVSVYIDEYECYPRWAYNCMFTAGARLKVKDFLKYLNIETKEYLKLVSENKTFEILEKRQSLSVPENFALFGNIDDKYPFSMMINVKDTIVNGHYFYNSNKELIRLIGKIENGKLILKEYVSEKHTGTFIIEKIDILKKKIFWESPDKKKRFNVTINNSNSLYRLKI